MKKNIFFIALLALSICAFVAFNQYKKATDDVTPPKITSETDTITASVKITEEELLSGISALDDRCGDVTDTLVIEDISNFISENKRIITYAAIDDSMNVGRLELDLIYTDYAEPKFSLKAPLSFVVGSKINFLSNITAKSPLDGDLTKQIRYGLDSMVDNLVPGKYPIEFRVTDSCGKTSYLNTEVEVYDSSYSGIDVKLSKYLVYVPVGKSFNAESYFKESNIEGELSVISDVNTKKAGTYYVDYLVNGINASGKSRLVVVVY